MTRFFDTRQEWEREQELRYGSVIMDSDDLCLSCGDELEGDEADVCRDCVESQD